MNGEGFAMRLDSFRTGAGTRLPPSDPESGGSGKPFEYGKAFGSKPGNVTAFVSGAAKR